MAETQPQVTRRPIAALVLLALPVLIPIERFMTIGLRLNGELRYGLVSTMLILFLQVLPILIVWVGILLRVRWMRNAVWFLTPYALTLNLFATTWLYFTIGFGLVSLAIGLPIVWLSSIIYAIIIFIGCMSARKYLSLNKQ